MSTTLIVVSENIQSKRPLCRFSLLLLLLLLELFIVVTPLQMVVELGGGPV